MLKPSVPSGWLLEWTASIVGGTVCLQELCAVGCCRHFVVCGHFFACMPLSCAWCSLCPVLVANPFALVGKQSSVAQTLHSPDPPRPTTHSGNLGRGSLGVRPCFDVWFAGLV